MSHDLILAKCEAYGEGKSRKNYLLSYLSNRKQRTKVNSLYSDSMAEKWDPVQGFWEPRDLWDLWDPRDYLDPWEPRDPRDPRDAQYLKIPWTPGTPRTSGTFDPLEPQDLKTLGKLPLSFEIQNLNNQKLWNWRINKGPS